MKISKKLFVNLAELVKNAFPNEVGGVIFGKEIADDFVLFPAQFSRHYIRMNLFNIPIYSKVIGTFHSHPTGSLRPSQADLQMFFKTGTFHIIFGMENFKCYNSSGKEIKLEIM